MWSVKPSRLVAWLIAAAVVGPLVGPIASADETSVKLWPRYDPCERIDEENLLLCQFLDSRSTIFWVEEVTANRLGPVIWFGFVKATIDSNEVTLPTAWLESPDDPGGAFNTNPCDPVYAMDPTADCEINPIVAPRQFHLDAQPDVPDITPYCLWEAEVGISVDGDDVPEFGSDDFLFVERGACP